MIRTASELRALLNQPIPDTGWGSRFGRAVFLRDLWRFKRCDYYRAYSARCRSVREQQRWEQRETDGLPFWL